MWQKLSAVCVFVLAGTLAGCDTAAYDLNPQPIVSEDSIIIPAGAAPTVTYGRSTGPSEDVASWTACLDLESRLSDANLGDAEYAEEVTTVRTKHGTWEATCRARAIGSTKMTDRLR